MDEHSIYKLARSGQIPSIKVEFAFSEHRDERLTNISQGFEEAKEKIIQSSGRDAFTPAGELKEEFRDTPLGRYTDRVFCHPHLVSTL